MQTLRTPQRRAGCAPLDALSTHRMHVAGRDQDVPDARQKTRWSARRETRRLRAGRRAVLRAGKRAALRAGRRAALRAARRAGCTSQDAPVARRKTRRFACRKTRRLRAGRRTGCAPCARAGPSVLFPWRRAEPRSVVRRGRRVADGAGSPSRLGRGASLSPLAATGKSTQHLSHARRARVAVRPSVCGDVF